MQTRLEDPKENHRKRPAYKRWAESRSHQRWQGADRSRKTTYNGKLRETKGRAL